MGASRLFGGILTLVLSLTLGFVFLYLPMVILVIYSFNASKLVTVWAGFSTRWYGELLQNEAFLNAAWVTLKVAVISSSTLRGAICFLPAAPRREKGNSCRTILR